MEIEERLIFAANQLESISWDNIDDLTAQQMDSNISFGKAMIQERDWPLISVLHLEAIAFFVQGNTDAEVQELYIYALQRRSLLVQKATERLVKITKTGRNARLSENEQIDCDTAFQTIYINICGIFDVFSVLFNFYKNGNEIRQTLDVDLTKKSFREKLEIKKLDTLVKRHEEWIKYLKTNIRHKIVHQIPPYIPPCEMTPEELTEHDRLEDAKWQALTNEDIKTAEHHELAQSKLGRFSPYVAFTELGKKNGRMDICTILNDVITAQKFISECSIILNEVRLAKLPI